MLLKELFGIGIAPDLHGVDLPLRPFVQIETADKGDVDAHPTMCRGAIQTEEDAVGGRRPRGPGGGAVEADGVGGGVLDLAELGVFAGRGDAGLALPRGGDGSIELNVAGHGHGRLCLELELELERCL